ncbi:uncharacterized protein B0T23DRAFT_397208 [Neurospora hispaniola]|uniref:Uncharacterized protein n=1 Tax=Neurospora hispaniola TaxID=588809 RepID=A0AAJ0I6K7_9PEZI|nr:hypothetical protein B0T23DRAFT_397208 [Neurospora hispaniola]
MFSSYQDFLGNSVFPLPVKPSLYDGRLELFAKLGKSLYGTNYGATRAKSWWHYDEDTFGVSNQNHIAAAYAHKPDYQVDGSLAQDHPCNFEFLSPMDDILNMYRQLAIRVSVIAAVHTNETQYVPFIGERSERQWLANKERAQVCYHAAMIAHIVGILLVVFMHRGFWKLDREYSMSPLELMNAVTHGSDESARSLLHILREAEENASASRLKGFAHEWDVEHEQLVVYTKGGDGHWGFKVKAEEYELAEQQ